MSAKICRTCYLQSFLGIHLFSHVNAFRYITCCHTLEGDLRFLCDTRFIGEMYCTYDLLTLQCLVLCSHVIFTSIFHVLHVSVSTCDVFSLHDTFIFMLYFLSLLYSPVIFPPTRFIYFLYVIFPFSVHFSVIMNSFF